MRGSESVFQWDVWICVGSYAETAGSLRYPETPSYINKHMNVKHWEVLKAVTDLFVFCPQKFLIIYFLNLIHVLEKIQLHFTQVHGQYHPDHHMLELHSDFLHQS